MSLTETLSVADRFALSLDGLRRVVAARIAGGMMAAAMILLVWQRLQRIERRIKGMLARFRQGRLVVRRAVISRVGVVRSGGGVARLPRDFAWLVKLVPYQAACFAGQISTLLGEPEMVALLAAAPQARRVLAPLCRMLGIDADVLRPRGALSEGAGSTAAVVVPQADENVAAPPDVMAMPQLPVPHASGRLRR